MSKKTSWGKKEWIQAKGTANKTNTTRFPCAGMWAASSPLSLIISGSDVGWKQYPVPRCCRCLSQPNISGVVLSHLATLQRDDSNQSSWELTYLVDPIITHFSVATSDYRQTTGSSLPASSGDWDEHWLALWSWLSRNVSWTGWSENGCQMFASVSVMRDFCQ